MANTEEAACVPPKAMSTLESPFHNTLHLHNLPTEIFVEILLGVTVRPLGKQYYHSVAILSLVCRYWRRVVISTPSLWSIVSHQRSKSEKTGDAYMALVLQRSGAHPITVDLDLSGGEHRLTDAWPRWVHDALLESHRWKAARLRNMDPVADNGFLHTFFNTPNAPILQELRLEASAATQTIGWPIYSGGMPHIRRLSLSNTLLVVQIPMSTLTSLSVSNPQPRAVPVVGLLKLISACPNLVELELRHLYDDSTSPSNQNYHIGLPHLSSLIIDGCGSHLITKILESVVIPVCQRVFITTETSAIDLHSEDMDPDPEMFLNIMAQFMPLMETCTEVQSDFRVVMHSHKVMFGVEWDEWNRSPDLPYFFFGIEEMFIRDSIPLLKYLDVIERIGLHRDRPGLRVRLAPHYWGNDASPEQELRQRFLKWSRVEALHCNTSSGLGRALIEALPKPLPNAALHFPQLRALYIVFSSEDLPAFDEPLLASLVARFQASEKGGFQALETIKLYSYGRDCDHLMRRMREAMAGVRVWRSNTLHDDVPGPWWRPKLREIVSGVQPF